MGAALHEVEGQRPREQDRGKGLSQAAFGPQASGQAQPRIPACLGDPGCACRDPGLSGHWAWPQEGQEGAYLHQDLALERLWRGQRGGILTAH